ncbi:MAG: hypothetical protein ACKOZW_14295, partial [Cyanobium sp.]
MLAGVAGLHGCAWVGPLQSYRHQTLHVYVVPSANEGPADGRNAHLELAGPVVEAYRRLHPNVSIRMQVVPERDLERQLRVHRLRGLGPDLLLVRAPVAISLARKRLIRPLSANLRRSDGIASVNPAEINRVRDAGQLVGLPVAQEVSLACFDRRRVSASPTEIGGVLSLAASGASVGVSVDPIGIWWTAGSLWAGEARALLITDHPIPPGLDREADLSAAAV